MDPARIPVIIGIGQVADREPAHADGPTPVDLAGQALALAAADAGGIALEQIDSLSVVGQISFRDIPDFDARLCEHLAITPVTTRMSEPTGDSPVRLLNEAANAIGSGETSVAAIVGAEALRTAARRMTGDVFGTTPEGDSSLRQRYGLRAPAAIYPFYEQATRSRWRQSAAEAQAESALIWEGMAKVAASEEAAWIRSAPKRGTIAQATPDNRLISYPYTKLMVANAGVNQGAAVIVASLAVARHLGVPETRLIYPGAGAAAHESEDPLQRVRYDRSIGMEKALERALQRNGLTHADIDHVELYSCFPVVPKMARRALNWPAERPVTCFGGLTFGGGPIANYMTHAIASMVARLRREPGCGLLFGNGGYATHYHAMILSSTLPDEPLFPQDFSVQSEVEAERGPSVPIDDEREGPARIETYSLLYARDGSPEGGVILARRSDDTRVIAKVDGTDAALVALLTDGTREPVGMHGIARCGQDGLMHWQPAA